MRKWELYGVKSSENDIPSCNVRDLDRKCLPVCKSAMSALGTVSKPRMLCDLLSRWQGFGFQNGGQ